MLHARWLGVMTLIALHEVGVRFLYESRWMEVIMAAGFHVQPLHMFVAVLFVGVRLALFLLLPGWLMYVVMCRLLLWRGEKIPSHGTKVPIDGAIVPQDV